MIAMRSDLAEERDLDQIPLGNRHRRSKRTPRPDISGSCGNRHSSRSRTSAQLGTAERQPPIASFSNPRKRTAGVKN